MSLNLDLGGSDLIVNSIAVGATAPGQAGTVLSGSEITVLDSVTPGTAAASKALVLNSSKGISTITTLGVTTENVGTSNVATQLNLAAASSIKTNAAAITATSNVGTMTGSWAATVTTPALTTAAGSSQTEVLTLTGVAAGDIVLLSKAGGTNTRAYSMSAVTTSNTITVTITNTEASNALNGTIIFNVLWLKA